MHRWVIVLDTDHDTYIIWYFSICAHVWSELSYSTCLRHLLRSRIVTYVNVFFEKDIFSVIRAQYGMRYHLMYHDTDRQDEQGMGFIYIFFVKAFHKVISNF